MDRTIAKVIEINSIAHDIRELAKAFQRTGNLTVYRELDLSAKHIMAATRVIRDHRHDVLDEAKVRAQKSLSDEILERFKTGDVIPLNAP